MASRTALYGLMAEFADPVGLVAAARRTHEEGYRCVDAAARNAVLAYGWCCRVPLQPTSDGRWTL